MGIVFPSPHPLHPLNSCRYTESETWPWLFLALHWDYSYCAEFANQTNGTATVCAPQGKRRWELNYKGGELRAVAPAWGMGNSTAVPGSCHEPTALLSVLSLTCKANSARLSLCCQSPIIAQMCYITKEKMLYSQEVPQTKQLNRILHTKQGWNCILYEVGREKKGSWGSVQLTILFLLLCRCSNVFNANAPMFLLPVYWKCFLNSNSTHNTMCKENLKCNETQKSYCRARTLAQKS